MGFGSVETKVTSTGTTVIGKLADITFGTSGVLKEVLVNVGDEVEEGQVLALLDSSQAELKLEQAQSALRVAQLKLEQLTSEASG